MSPWAGRGVPAPALARRAALVLAAFPALLAALVVTGSARAADRGPELTARSAIAVEAGTGEVVYARAADRRRPIASTTKLMTALLVLERGRLSEKLPAAAYAGLAVESKIDLQAGERMRVADLLRALLLASANDAAATLAEGVAGSRPAFVRRMNRRARQLGLERTHFANPIGLDEPGNHSSARDLAALALRLRRFAFFRRVVDDPGATLHTGARPRTLANRNRLVREESWMSGIKTGHTQQAGYVLVGSGTPRPGLTFVTVVLGTPSERVRDDDTRALMAWAARRYRRRTLLRRGTPLAAGVPIRFRRGARVPVVAARGLRGLARVGQGRPELRVSGLPAEIVGPKPRGHRVGTVEVRLGGRRVGTVPAVTGAAVPETGLGQQAKEWSTRPALLALAAAVLSGTVLLTRRRRNRGRPGPPARQEAEV